MMVGMALQAIPAVCFIYLCHEQWKQVAPRIIHTLVLLVPRPACQTFVQIWQNWFLILT